MPDPASRRHGLPSLSSTVFLGGRSRLAAHARLAAGKKTRRGTLKKSQRVSKRNAANRILRIARLKSPIDPPPIGPGFPANTGLLFHHASTHNPSARPPPSGARSRCPVRRFGRAGCKRFWRKARGRTRQALEALTCSATCFIARALPIARRAEDEQIRQAMLEPDGEACRIPCRCSVEMPAAGAALEAPIGQAIAPRAATLEQCFVIQPSRICAGLARYCLDFGTPGR